jgi:hypothetical protein
MSKTSSITYVRESGGGGQYPHLFYHTVIEWIAELYNKKPEELDEQTKHDALILYYILYWRIGF